MANAPFKLRSQGSSFKMMGSSPTKQRTEWGDKPKPKKSYESELLNTTSKEERTAKAKEDVEYDKLKSKSKKIGTKNLTDADRVAWRKARDKSYEEGTKRRANVRAHGTYEEYLTGDSGKELHKHPSQRTKKPRATKGVGGGKGSLSKKDWLELNKQNIEGRMDE